MTTEEKDEIKKAVLADIQAESQDVSELEVVDTLDGVQSLPTMKGGQLVSAPVNLLSKPATDAAAKAEVATQDAIAKADSAVRKPLGDPMRPRRKQRPRRMRRHRKLRMRRPRPTRQLPRHKRRRNSLRTLRPRPPSLPRRLMRLRNVPRPLRLVIRRWLFLQGMALRPASTVLWRT